MSLHIVNFIQSERTLHFLRSEECEECDCASKDKSKMAENADACIEKVCRVFGVSKLFPEQEKALKAFINKNDVLPNLPTRFGKSLVFQMAPLVHAGLSTCDDRFASNPIVVVISPLVSLMEDQTNFLLAQGISAGLIGEDKAVNAKIENGECCVVFTSPESLVGNGRWRSMLSSDIYKNLIGIVVDEAHCISHW